MLVDVTIQRRELKDHSFSIEAETLEDAEDKAGQQSLDYDWANSSVFYKEEEVDDVYQIS